MAIPAIVPGHNLISGRRTAKKEYGENLAVRWGWTVPGAVSVEKVADHVPKLGYDVRITLAEGKHYTSRPKLPGPW